MLPRPHDEVESVEYGRRAAAVGEGDPPQFRCRGGGGRAGPVTCCAFAAGAAGSGCGGAAQKRSRTTSSRVPAEPRAVISESMAGSRACTT
ncbi:hypothetical protein [Streptomyces sp. MMS21 TC-5]|uniref:hypothetical protein n=1 Tax=Streptomyces sp. MMS21 TC-5 TaxID=2925833 RepID=UPI0027E3A6C4|nr:hypothetical protein [Streptomyces sp. MMS21 TC-5]